MNRTPLIAATTLALAVVPLTMTAPAAAATIDREQRMCGPAFVSAEFERDGQQREVDVEVESGPGERWTFVVRDARGTVLTRLSGTTGRDGEWDTWRYLPTRPDSVRVTARGPEGQSCVMRLSLRA
jgi:hypothetical protein